MVLRAGDFPVLLERLSVDDETLLKMHQTLLYEISKKEDAYLNTSHGSSYNNQLHLTMARLAYGFVKEEYEHVLNEMLQRGLTAS
ncbi:MAG: hypothetical protein LBU32_06375 [Clostridiales bacterium]|jgi:hypothetical protein|nr:hypothetical protein [Clostridiales bacterium]